MSDARIAQVTHVEMTPLLFGAKDAAKLLGISPRTLWTLSVGREIPHVRIGRLVMYDPQDLHAWIESKKQYPGEPT